MTNCDVYLHKGSAAAQRPDPLSFWSWIECWLWLWWGLNWLSDVFSMVWYTQARNISLNQLHFKVWLFINLFTFVIWGTSQWAIAAWSRLLFWCLQWVLHKPLMLAAYNGCYFVFVFDDFLVFQALNEAIVRIPTDSLTFLWLYKFSGVFLIA